MSTNDLKQLMQTLRDIELDPETRLRILEQVLEDMPVALYTYPTIAPQEPFTITW